MLLTYLLDTSVFSALTSLHGPLPLALLAWCEANIDRCYISAISLHELEFGLRRLALRKSAEDRIRAGKLRIFHQLLFLKLSDRIVPVDNAILLHSSHLRAIAERTCGDIGFCDAVIAASADLGNHVVVTFNTRHFMATGVQTLDGRVLTMPQAKEYEDTRVIPKAERVPSGMMH
nr:PIN domain-containing protein [uncultured Dongia sp.]